MYVHEPVVGLYLHGVSRKEHAWEIRVAEHGRGGTPMVSVSDVGMGLGGEECLERGDVRGLGDEPNSVARHTLVQDLEVTLALIRVSLQSHRECTRTAAAPSQGQGASQAFRKSRTHALDTGPMHDQVLNHRREGEAQCSV